MKITKTERERGLRRRKITHIHKKNRNIKI